MLDLYQDIRRVLVGHNKMVRSICSFLGSFDLPEPDRYNRDLNLQTSMDFLDYGELEEHTRTQDCWLNFITHVAIILSLAYFSVMPFVDPGKNPLYLLLIPVCWVGVCYKK
jgi:hypothetical protein